MMKFGRTKTAPTPYPRIVFHLIRLAQMLSSLVVMSIMFYFIWNLIHEHFEAPKTFFTLLAAALFTFLSIFATTILYACFGLSPVLNLCLNALSFLTWAPAFGYLWFYTRATLSHVCNKANWSGPVGIMVCRIYKALFAFAILGTLSSLAALILDIYIWRKTTSRGKYSQMKDAEKPSGIGAPGQPYNAPAYSDSRSSIAMEQYTTPSTQRDAQSGYQIPEEQFNYDTSYHGGHQPDASAQPPKK